MEKTKITKKVYQKYRLGGEKWDSFKLQIIAKFQTP